jgi:hypothetical protein
MSDLTALQSKYLSLRPVLDERQRRLWAAIEARAMGRGGISRVAAATGLARNTIRAGLRELQPSPLFSGSPAARVRRPAAGRPSAVPLTSTMIPDLEALLEPIGSNGPSPLRWTCCTLRQLAVELRHRGHCAGPRAVAGLLRQLGYDLLATRQCRPGAVCPERQAQLASLNETVRTFLLCGLPVLFVQGRRHQGPCLPSADAQSLLSPDAATAAHAVAALERWWDQIGTWLSPSRILLVTPTHEKDSPFCAAWQNGLLRWTAAARLPLDVSLLPPATHRWQQVNHQMVTTSTLTAPGTLPEHHEVVIQMIGDPAAVAPRPLPPSELSSPRRSRRGPSFPDLDCKRIIPADGLGTWNYTIVPPD